MFVDRHFYSHDSAGHGRWHTLTRATQLRWLVFALLLVGFVFFVGGVAVHGWLRPNSAPESAVALAPVVRAVEPPPSEVGEAAALRAALDESRGKLAALAAELEGMKRRPVHVGPTQEEFDRLRADYDEAVQRAEAAEQAAAQSAEALEIVRKEAAGPPPINAADVPDRIRALELELEMARATAPPGEPAAMSDPRYEEDPLDHAFTPQEEDLARRVRELEATVGELEAERGLLEERLAAAGLDTPSGSAEPTDNAEPAASGNEQELGEQNP